MNGRGEGGQGKYGHINGSSYLEWFEFVVDEQCKHDRWQYDKFDSECVMGLVICRLELSVHQIARAER